MSGKTVTVVLSVLIIVAGAAYILGNPELFEKPDLDGNRLYEDAGVGTELTYRIGGSSSTHTPIYDLEYTLSGTEVHKVVYADGNMITFEITKTLKMDGKLSKTETSTVSYYRTGEPVDAPEPLSPPATHPEPEVIDTAFGPVETYVTEIQLENTAVKKYDCRDDQVTYRMQYDTEKTETVLGQTVSTVNENITLDLESMDFVGYVTSA